MARLTVDEKLAIYRKVLVDYEAADDPKASVQRRLIAGLEREKAAAAAAERRR